MNQRSHPNQPEDGQPTRAGIRGLVLRVVNHPAAVAILTGTLVSAAGIILLQTLGSQQALSDTSKNAGIAAVGALAAVVVCLVAFIQNKIQKSQFLASVDPERLQDQQSAMQEMADLDGDFCDLRDRLCQGPQR